MRSTTIKVRFIQMISVSIVMCLILIFLVTGFSWPIAQIYDEYLTDADQYDRFKSYRNFINSLNIAVFGMDDVLLAAYYIPRNEEADGSMNCTVFMAGRRCLCCRRLSWRRGSMNGNATG